MRRNAGIIGLQQLGNYNNTGLSGTFDLFDQRNIHEEGNWPETVKVDSIIINDTTPNEGTAVTFTINTSGVINGSDLYYSIVSTGGSDQSDDFADGTLLGSFEVTSNQGFISKMLTGSATLTEPSDQFVLQVRKDSTSGDILYTSSTV